LRRSFLSAILSFRFFFRFATPLVDFSAACTPCKEDRRMKLLALLAILMTAVAGCATANSGTDRPSYYVMRHLHTPAGERDPDLTAEGRRQADLLTGRFEGSPPQAIYVSHFKRAQQTAAPLAAWLGLTPIIYDPADSPALISLVRAGPLPALIVGHSNTVPDIIEQLGGARPAPLTHEDFGDVWSIRPDGQTLRSPIAEMAQPRPR
jgi:phosphohistidine phosphatase SixA